MGLVCKQMCALFRKTTAIEKRRRKLERELALLNSDIRALSRASSDPLQRDLPKLRSSAAEPLKRPASAVEPLKRAASGTTAQNADKKSVKAKQGSLHHEERFSEYLSSEFQTIGSLKNERNLQRNKAVVMLIAVVLFVLWLWSQFL